MNEEKTKICNKCKEEKNINSFNKDKTKKDGLHTICKTCKQKTAKEYYQKNRTKILEHDKEYHLKNKEKRNQQSREYYQKNRERILEWDKKYQQENKDAIRQRDKEYREKNKEKIRQRKKLSWQKHRKKRLKHAKEYYRENKEDICRKNIEYYNKNRERILLREKTYQKKNREKIRKRRYNNINHRIAHNMRARIKAILKDESKSKSTMELIGCSIDEFKEHLENQFEEGMTWKNYGYYGWHVEHRIPCVCFNLSKPEEQEKCFNYRNLRPLWAKDNLSRPRDGSDIKQ